MPINDTMAVLSVHSIPNFTTVPSDNSGGGNTQDSIVLRIVLFCLVTLIFSALLVLAYFVFSLRSPWASRHAADADADADSDSVDAHAADTKTTADTSGKKEQVPTYGLV